MNNITSGLATLKEPRDVKSFLLEACGRHGKCDDLFIQLPDINNS